MSEKLTKAMCRKLQSIEECGGSRRHYGGAKLVLAMKAAGFLTTTCTPRDGFTLHITEAGRLALADDRAKTDG